MIKMRISACTIICIFALMGCRSIRNSSDSKPITHEVWGVLLKKHVNTDGWVDYRAFRADSVLFDTYLNLLSSAHPNDKNWSRNEQMAYWINAYNAFTIKLVADYYPVASIKDIKNGIPFVNTVWDIKFIKIEQYTYDLNNIEHNILRPIYKDARIHAAVNCASYSCPPLLNEAYVADRLNAQLDTTMTRFVNDPLRNRISSEKAELSEIFKWFKRDFEEDGGSRIDFVNRYARMKITPKIAVSYIDYDWGLNDVRK
jgi:Protein of unknown function, DUF547